MHTRTKPNPFAVTVFSRFSGFVLTALGIAVCPITPATARNADLSLWTANLSESAIPGEPGTTDRNPEIVTEGDFLHVFWFTQHPVAGHQVCYRRSADRGRSWGPVISFYQQDDTLNAPVVSPLDRHLAVHNGQVHIAFGAYGTSSTWYGKLVYLRSIDNGVSFEAPQTLWASGGPGVTSEPWHAYNTGMTAGDGKVAISYRRQPNWYGKLGAHLLISGDGGDNFTDRTVADEDTGGWNVDDVAFSGNLMAVLFTQNTGAKSELHAAVSPDGGATFLRQRISVPSSDGVHWTAPAHDEHYSKVVACDAGKVHVVWRGRDETNTYSIFHRRSPDGGQTWSTPTNLTAGTALIGGQLTSQYTIATHGDLVWVLMHTSTAKLYLRKSSDGGATFGPVIEVTDPAGASLAADAWWPVMKRVPTGVPGVMALDIVTTGLKRFRSLDDGGSFTLAATGPVWSLWNSDRPEFAADDAGNTHIVCEGKWTWYSTGVFGDLDTLYSRFDAAPAAGSGGVQALHMITARNTGDGSGNERFDSMLVPDDGSLLPRSAVTIECWAKTQLGAAGVENYFLQKQGPGAGGAWDTVLMGNWRTGLADVRLATESAGQVLVGGPSIVDGAWHHIAVAYDSQAPGVNMRLFVDGQEAASVSATGLLKAGRGPLLIGAEKDQRSNAAVTVDDVRIWNRALTGDEIRARKDHALTGSEPGLVAWHPLDGSTRDASCHGHHGVLLYQESFVPGVTGSPAVVVPIIVSSTILNGETGQSVSYRIVTTPPASSFSAAGLPSPLVCDPATGVISGVAAAPGLFPVNLTATGPAGTASMTLTLHIRAVDEVLFDNGNIGGVSSGPTQPTVFTLTAPALITFVSDYHYFNGGTPPGTIGLRHDDGTLYGPWQTSGRIGQGGVANAYWDAWPMVTLPAGAYTVVDSSPATWSWNSGSGSRGFTMIRGISGGTTSAALFAAWAANNGLAGANAETGADPDGDQRANWMEVALGGNPLRAEPVPAGLVTTTAASGPAASGPAVSYTLCRGAIGIPGSDQTVNGTRIVIEASPLLDSGSWVPAWNLLDVASALRTNNGDGTETVVVPFRDDRLGEGRWFARERLTRVGGP